MRVELSKLKPNRMRDLRVDPIEEDDLGPLVASITEHGFWGGVVICKTDNGVLEIAAGHRRVLAAMEARITHADLAVGKYDDAQMVAIYTDENALQRGERGGVALAGAVASAIKYLIKAILTDDKNLSSRICDDEHSLEKAKSAILSDKLGLGERTIGKFFNGKISQSLIKDHVANLKASGDYARIVKEVTDEIALERARELAELERKEREAEKAQRVEEAAKAKAKKDKARAKYSKEKETAEKAAEASASKKPTLDLAGVGRYLKNEWQLRTFRKLMERPAVQAKLPFERQAAYAKELVKIANDLDVDLTGQFIEDYTNEMVAGVAADYAQKQREAKAQEEAENEQIKFYNLQERFCSHVNGIARDGQQMLDMKDRNPALKFRSRHELEKALGWCVPILNELANKYSNRK